nr:hypothetical protein [uncultured Desulfuromonas sp.]
MRQHFSIVCGFLLLCVIADTSMVAGIELKGQISQVSENAIHITLEKKLLPQIGDDVTIFESIPGVGLIPLEGDWEIATATSSQIIAIGDPASSPFVGQSVSVNSPDPQHEHPANLKAQQLYQQGLNYYHGREDLPQDLGKAFDFFSQAAQAGHAKAQFKVGYCYSRGEYVAKDPVKAAQWYRKAAEQGYAPAQANLGTIYANGIGVPVDTTLAFQWYQKAAMQGHAGGQNGLGHLYQVGQGVEKNLEEAFHWIRKAALQNHRTAQYNLGLFYYSGWGIEKDLTEGTKWYRKAAQLGDVKGMRKMGAAYYWGHGVEQDYQQAISWYRKAAEKNDLPSLHAMGRIHDQGKGVPRDPVVAYDWYRKAAEQGDADSQFNVASALYNGDGVAKDRHQAYGWYQKAANQGNSYAQFALGLYSETGEGGITQNRQEALKWYRKAAAKGHKLAQKNIEKLTSTGSDKTVASNIPAGAKGYLEQLQSSDGRTQQKAAKELYRSAYKNNRAVLNQVADLLLSGCTTNLRDAHHIDAMAWLCNILGTSGEQRYRATLLDVLAKNTHKKIKKYAQSNASKLGS